MCWCESELEIAVSEENACTFEASLSVKIPRKQNSADVRSSVQFDILSGNHSPPNLTSEIESLSPTIMTAIMPLQRFPSLLDPAYSSLWHWVAFSKYILPLACNRSKSYHFLKESLVLLLNSLLLVVSYSITKLMVVEIFRAIGCTPGTMYDADVIHSRSSKQNKVVFL